MSEKDYTTRRNVLKKTALGTVGVVGVSGVASADANTSSSWGCSTDCPEDQIVLEELYLPNGVDYEREGAVCVHHRMSYWSNNEEKWKHIFSVSGGAGSTDQGTTGGKIYGQRYKVIGLDVNLKAHLGTSRYGHYPADDDSFIPGWGHPLMDAAVGTISTGAGWFLAVGDTLRDSMGHRPDGAELLPGGLEYGDMATSIWSPSPWTECGFFHRFTAESMSAAGNVHIEIEFSTHDSWASTTWRELEGVVQFFGTNDPEWPDTEELSSSPEEWPEKTREKYGIKDVRNDQITTDIDGGESVDFIATKPQISTDLDIVEKRESEMDYPHSERYRDDSR